MSDSNPMKKQIKEVTLPPDALGRVIKLRKPPILASYRFIEMLGKSADSETFCNMVLPIQYVVAIDDDNEIPLNTRREFDALLQRLDEEGVNAVMMGVQENFSPQSAAEQKDELKK